MADILILDPATQIPASHLGEIRKGHAVVNTTATDSRDPDLASAPEYDVVVLVGTAAEPVATAVGRAKLRWPMAEIIVIGSDTVNGRVEAIRCGAYDCLSPSSAAGRLAEVVTRAARRGSVLAEQHAGGAGAAADEPVAVDASTRALFAKASRFADVKSTILITGESGTGKEVLARRIHRESNRRHASFVPINCASIPESLVETELFGYKKGAFTGAHATTKGVIEAAEHGVLFLDEIGDMPLSLQVHLLRFLDAGEVRPVGASAVRRVDVRVIAATNCDLAAAVEEGRFRRDLYFRLSVIPLEVPPLRQRVADIPPLVRQHLRLAAMRIGIPVPAIDNDALSLLVQYRWPGNIRELQNAMEQAVVLCRDIVTPADLPATVQGATRAPSAALCGAMKQARMEARAPKDVEDLLMATLRGCNGNQTEAAATLGISRTTLWRRLRRLGEPATS